MSRDFVDAVGDRIKEYERRETGRKAMPGLPLVIRVDGRGFSRFTRGMNRPFDQDFADLMTDVTKFLVEQTHASVGFTQSLFRPNTVSLQSKSLFYRITTEVRQFSCAVTNVERIVS